MYLKVQLKPQFLFLLRLLYHKIMKKFLISLIIVFNIIVVIKLRAGAENIIPVHSEGDLKYYLDTSSFRATKGRTIHEFYYNIPLCQLSFDKTAAGFVDTLQLTLIITDSSNNKLLQKQWLDPIYVDSLEKIEGRFLPQQFEVTLYPGKYFVSLTMYELNTGYSGATLLKIRSPAYHGNSLNLSDIQIASLIEPDTSRNQYVKNRIKVIPNPNRLFGKTLPVLYFYFEIYNLQLTAIEEQNTYEIKYYLYDLNMNVVKEYPSKIKQKPGTSSFEIGGINVSTFDLSSLYLTVTVTDNFTSQTTTTEKMFWNLPPVLTSVG